MEFGVGLALGVLVGLSVGVCVGVVVAGLLGGARRRDDVDERVAWDRDHGDDAEARRRAQRRHPSVPRTGVPRSG